MRGDAELIAKFMLQLKRRTSVGFLTDEAHYDALKTNRTFCFGRTPVDEAHNLFACLRAFDGLLGVKTVYAPLPSKEGIGLAVYNRLAKAAGFCICDVVRADGGIAARPI